MPLSTIVSDKAGAASIYAQQGVVVVKSVLSDDEVAEIRSTFTDEIENSTRLGWSGDNIDPNDILARYPRFVHPHRHPESPAGIIARQWMMNQRLTSIASDLVGPVNGAQSMFYFKPPTARGQDLHQDNISLRSSPETCIAAWIAIDDCDAENGALVVVPGSHKVDLICPNELSNIEDSFTKNRIQVPDDIEKVQTEMKAGDVIFFHGNMVHGSARNKSKDRFRRSLIFHYVPQASKEVAKFYHPLISPSGEEIYISEAEGGGQCGEAWETGI